MEKKREPDDALDADERRDDLRDAVTSADATGMIAGEQLITEAETILPSEGE